MKPNGSHCVPADTISQKPSDGNKAGIQAAREVPTLALVTITTLVEHCRELNYQEVDGRKSEFPQTG